MHRFTRQERTVLLFLVVAFLIGSGIKIYQNHWQPLPPPTGPEDRGSEGLPTCDTMRIDGVVAEDIRIDINRADAETLQNLSGIGPVMAERIIAHRDRGGGFASIEELMEVKGIGIKTFQKIKELLIVE